MLCYLASGKRDYHRKKLHISTRVVWEFQAVVSGSLAPVLPGEAEQGFASRAMWVFPPGVAHGWSSPAGRPCEVVVFHFDAVPEPLAEACGAQGAMRVSLTHRDTVDLRRLSAELRGHHPKVTDLSVLWADRALLDLAVLALRGRRGRALTGAPDYGQRKVQQALSWFMENMADGVGVNETARAVGVSPAHLRRLFAESGGGSPLDRLTELRVGRAEQLLRGTAMGMAEIAEAVGMSGPTVFCRRFKQARGLTPGRWRERQ